MSLARYRAPRAPRNYEVKALASMPQSRAGGTGWGNGYGPWGTWTTYPLPPGAKTDYAREAGDLWRNSIVAIALGWLQDQAAQAEPIVTEPGAATGKAAERVPVAENAALDVLKEPNDFTSYDELMDAAWLSYKVDGNAYFIKARGDGGYGAPLNLWWTPHWLITPRWPPDGRTFIGWYDYVVDGKVYPLDPKDVIHIRAAPDPYNPRVGISRLKHVLRQIVGYNRAENFSASIVGNTGGIGVVWIPEVGGEVEDDSTAEGIKRRIERSTGDDNAGRPLVMGTPGRLERVGLSPEEMALDSLFDRPEATICAALGVNPMVLGLSVGAGMRSYANQGEADAQSWKNGVIPTQRRFARALTKQFLRVDYSGADRLEFGWDRSGVEALAEDASEKVNRAVTAYQGGICSLATAQRLAGMEPIPGAENVWYQGRNEAHDTIGAELEPGPADDAEGDDPDELHDPELNDEGD